MSYLLIKAFLRAAKIREWTRKKTAGEVTYTQISIFNLRTGVLCLTKLGNHYGLRRRSEMSTLVAIAMFLISDGPISITRVKEKYRYYWKISIVSILLSLMCSFGFSVVSGHYTWKVRSKCLIVYDKRGRGGGRARVRIIVSAFRNSEIWSITQIRNMRCWKMNESLVSFYRLVSLWRHITTTIWSTKHF
jgi:hypothetical protein